jgi:signal transduction histidine kinase
LEEIREAFESIIRSGHRASDVIGRIRALIKKSPFQRDRIAINGMIIEVLKFTRYETEKNGVSVRTEFAQGLPLIEGDRVQLQQVVLNLILNALDAMSDVREGAPELRISTCLADAGGVLVAVRDTGPGLDPKRMDGLFEAFYTTNPGGLGMGLAICRSIIEAHDGRLWAGLPFSLRSLLRRADSAREWAPTLHH